jgi:hypothetical protein
VIHGKCPSGGFFWHKENTQPVDRVFPSARHILERRKEYARRVAVRLVDSYRSWWAWSEYPAMKKYGASGGRPTNDIIIADCSVLVNGRLSNVTQNFSFALVDDVLRVPNRNVKLLRQRFKTNTIKPPTLEYPAVLLIKNVLLD